MSFGAQFLAGQKFAQGLIDTYRDAQQRRELDEISKAQPVSGDFLSDDASAKVQAAAADPTQQIGYDVGAKAYMATPKLGEDEMGPAQPKQIATAAPMTELLGKRTPGTMTPDQVSNAKFKAMADVVAKGDPIQGMRLQREVKQGERDDKRWEREDRKATEEEEFQKGQQAEFAQTIYGKRIGDYATQMQAYEQYQAKLKSGAAPETLGAPPPMPQRPAYSVAESLADNGRLLAFKASKGKADPVEILQYAERLQKVSDEGYGKALKLAQGGAPLAKVIEQFNQTGSMKLDPAAVVSDEMVKDADGVPSRVIKVRDASGNVQTINALSELDAIGQAESYFNRFDKNRTFKLKERELEEVKIRNAETKAELASIRAGLAAARGGGGGQGGTQDGEGAASFNPLANFDSKKAQAVAYEQAAASVDANGKPLSPAEQGKLAQKIYRSMEDEFANENIRRQRVIALRNDASQATTQEEIEALRQRALASGYTPEEMVAIDKRFATTKDASPTKNAGTNGKTNPDKPTPEKPAAAPYEPPSDSPAGKAKAAREAAQKAAQQQQMQKMAAVTKAASDALASKDPSAAQAVQDMPGFDSLPTAQKSEIRRIVFGR